MATISVTVTRTLQGHTTRNPKMESTLVVLKLFTASAVKKGLKGFPGRPVSQHRDGVCSWNLDQSKTMSRVFYTCWWPWDTRRQSISSHDIHLVIPVSSQEGWTFNYLRPGQTCVLGSGNGLVPSGITWTNIDQNLCRHMTSLGHNVLIRLCY